MGQMSHIGSRQGSRRVGFSAGCRPRHEEAGRCDQNGTQHTARSQARALGDDQAPSEADCSANGAVSLFFSSRPFSELTVRHVLPPASARAHPRRHPRHRKQQTLAIMNRRLDADSDLSV